MNDNRYALAGWAAIAQAVIFPTAFVVGIIQGIIGAAAFHYHGPMLGPADMMFLVFTALAVYTLYMFRKLLNERYSFHDVDFLITAAILWNIIFQISSLALKFIALVLSPPEIVVPVLFISFITVSMVTAGIIDILIAARLLQLKDTVSDLMKAFIYITMASGILQVSVVLSPLALLLVPISCAILGTIFLRGQREEVEFV